MCYVPFPALLKIFRLFAQGWVVWLSFRKFFYYSCYICLSAYRLGAIDCKQVLAVIVYRVLDSVAYRLIDIASRDVRAGTRLAVVLCAYVLRALVGHW